MARAFYKEDGEAIPAIQYVDEQPVGYTLITDTTELRRCYMSQYHQRELDGRDWFEEFRADLMMDIIAGTYTPTEVFNLEQHLKSLTENIIAGSWLTAQSISTNLVLSGIYDQTMKDEIQLYIDTYVTNNY
jgi:hypothetical protein